MCPMWRAVQAHGERVTTQPRARLATASSATASFLLPRPHYPRLVRFRFRIPYFRFMFISYEIILRGPRFQAAAWTRGYDVQ